MIARKLYKPVVVCLYNSIINQPTDVISRKPRKQGAIMGIVV